MEKEKQKSFLLYLEHEELINQLSNDDAGELFKGLFEYINTGKTPNLSPMSNLVFISIRQDLDRNAQKYEEKLIAQRENGKKGGRPRKNIEEENPKKPTVFSKTQKTLYDNVNYNLNLNDNLSLSKIEKDISSEEREILESYIKRKKLATKSVKAYAQRLIDNGDYRRILESERTRCTKKANGVFLHDTERIKRELASIVDKRSCAKVLAQYYVRGDPPKEFSEVMERYDLDSYDKVELYGRELCNNTP